LVNAFVEVFSETQWVFIILGLAISYRLFHVITSRIVGSKNPEYSKLFLENKGYMRGIWVRAHRLDGKKVKKYLRRRRRFIYLKPGEHTVTLSCTKSTSFFIGTAFQSFDLIDIRVFAEPNKVYVATLESATIVIKEIQL